MNKVTTSFMLPLIIAVTATVFSFTPAYSQNKFKLKPGATGKICTTCHVDFEEKLKSKFLHTPVESGDCSACHNPHAASHDKLLSADASEICAECHGNMVPDGVMSSHQVVVKGQCVLCHDPHGSNNRNNLLAAGNELCFGCHKDMKIADADIKFRHKPVESGCLSCHDPHASKKAKHLLASPLPSLCNDCHQSDTPVFKKVHNGYPVQDARCTSCHNPHGSSTAAILYDNVHVPLQNKMCNQCHMDPSSPEPLALQKTGYEICRGCHYDLVNDALNKKRMHWPLLDDKGCVNCHSPHASMQKKLLLKPMEELCGSCHADTLQRLVDSPVQHEPVAEGNCMVCHEPHSSNSMFILKRPTIVDVCGGCHDYSKHSSHPIGEKAIDKRNSNLIVQCTSCHRTHGIKNEHLIHFSTIQDLCVQCHTKFKR